MANSIDERIVEMRFDNKQFENGVESTMSLLDKLKQSLKFEDSVKGFEELDKAAGKVDMNPIGNAVDTVKMKFSALEVVAMTTLATITRQAVMTGERLVKSFTLDPVMKGFTKYESKVAAVQTILNAAEGLTMEDVEKSLDKLSWYTNETSYNFDAMVKSISQFTSAGIDLETATNAIIGFANAGAAAGATVQNVDHGMTGISRAISSGYMSLGIWNSFMKTANMQSAGFIKQAIKIAAEMGVLKKSVNQAGEEIYKTAKGTEVSLSSFSNTLQEKWLNQEVLTKLLSSYTVATDEVYKRVQETGEETFKVIAQLEGKTDEFSLKALKAAQETKTWSDTINYVKESVAQGWSETWETIFGNYEEARDFYSELVEYFYDLFVSTGEVRNNIMDIWKENGGAQAFRNTLLNIASVIDSVANRVREALIQMFPILGDQEGLGKLLANITKGAEAFTSKLADVFEFANPFFRTVEDFVEEAIGGEEKIQEGADKIEKTLKSIDELAKSVIRGEYGNGQTRIDKLGNNYYAVQNKVNELLNSTFRYGEELVALADLTDEAADSQEKLATGTNKAAKALENGRIWSQRALRTHENLLSTFRGVVATVQLVAYAFESIGRIIVDISHYFFEFGEGVLGVSATFGDFMVQLKDFVIENDLIYRVLKKIVEVAETALMPLIQIFESAMENLANRKTDFQDWVENLDLLGISAEEVAGWIEAIGQTVQNVFGKIGPIFDKAKTKIGEYIGKIREAVSETDIIGSLFEGNIFSQAIGTAAGIGFLSFQKLQEALGIVVDLFGKAKEKVIGFVEQIGPALEIVSYAWDSFYKPLLKNFLRTSFTSILPKGQISDLIKKYIDFSKAFGKMRESLIDFSKKVEPEIPTFNLVTDVLEKFNGTLKSLGQLLLGVAGKGLSKLGEIFKPVGDALKRFQEIVTSIDYSKVLRLGILFGVFTLLFKLLSIASSLASAAENFSLIGKAINTFVKSLNIIKYVSVITTFTACVVALLGAVYLIAKLGMNHPWALVGGIVAVISVMGVLAGVVFALLKFVKTADTLKAVEISGAILGVAAAIALVIGSLYFLTKVTWNELMDSIGKMILVFGLLAAMLFVLNLKIFGNNMMDYKQALGFFIFMTALQKAVEVVKELSIQPYESMVKGIKMLGGIAVALSIMALGVSKIKINNGFGLLALVGAVFMFVKMLEAMANADYEGIYKSLILLSPIFGLIIVLSVEARKAGTGALSIAAMIAALGFAIGSMADALAKIGGLTNGQLSRGIFGLIVVFGGLAALGAIANKVQFTFKKGSWKEIVGYFIGMSIACLAIATSIKMLSGLKMEELAPAFTALGSIIVAFGVACKLASGMKNKAAPLLAMAGVIAAIAVSLLILSFVDWDKILTGALAIGGVVLAVGESLSKISGFKTKGMLSQVVLIGLLIAGTTAALYELAQIGDWKQLLSSGVSLGLVILAIGRSFKLMESIKWNKFVAPMSAMAAVLMFATGSLIAVLGMNANWDQMIMAAASISLLMLALGKTFQYISALRGVIPSPTQMLSLMYDMAIFTGGITTIILAIGAIENLLGEYHLIEGALTVIKKVLVGIADILGSVIGEFVSSLALGTTNKLPLAAHNLEQFTGVLKDFVDVLSGNGKMKFDEVLSTTQSIKESLKNISDSSAYTFDYPTLSTNLRILIQALNGFYKEFSLYDIDVEKVKSAAEALQLLTSIQPPETVEGGNSWEKLATGFDSLAEAILAFDKIVEGENAVDFDKITEGFKAVSELAKVATGMDLSGFEGWDKLIGFQDSYGYKGTGLQRLATALVQFETAFNGGVNGHMVDLDRLENSLGALKLLADTAKTVPEAGGILGKFLGEFTWDTLSTGLEKLAEAMVNFSWDSLIINEAGLQAGIQSIKDINEVAKDIDPAKAGLFQKFITGDSTIDGLATALEKLGPSLAGFVENLKGYNYLEVAPAFTLIRRIIAIPEMFQTYGTDNEQLVWYGQAIEKFAEHVYNMYETLAAINVPSDDGAQSMPEFLRGLLEAVGEFIANEDVLANLQAAGQVIQQGMLDGLMMAPEAMSSAIFAWSEALYNQVINSDNTVKYENAGKYVVESITKGITDNKKTAITAVDTMIGDIVIKIRTWYGGEGHGMFGAGQHLMNGLIAGMESKRGDLIAKAVELAEAVNSAFEGAEKINSPSKIWQGYGSGFGEGLIIGMDKIEGDVVKSAEHLAKAVNGEFSTSARITPVVDISGASYSASRLNNMINAQRAAAISALMEINSQVTQIDRLVDVTNRILGSIQNGSDLYIDDDILAGRINRRLGIL